jgi:hypothetical protein
MGGEFFLREDVTGGREERWGKIDPLPDRAHMSYKE